MHRRTVSVSLGLLIAWAAVAALAEDGTPAEPGRWRTTTVSRVEMDGAETMPPQTHTQEECVEEHAFDPEGFLDPQSGCTTEHVDVNGSVMTFEMVCPGPTGTMRGNARYEFHATRGSGRVEMKVDVGGVSMRTIVEITAERIGDC